MFLEISQNLQENICATVFFSIKLQDCCNFIKKETLAQVLLCEFGEISKHTFFTEYLRMVDSKVFTTYPLGDLVNPVSTVFRNGLVFGLCLKILLYVPRWNIFVWIRIIYICYFCLNYDWWKSEKMSIYSTTCSFAHACHVSWEIVHDNTFPLSMNFMQVDQSIYWFLLLFEVIFAFGLRSRFRSLYLDTQRLSKLHQLCILSYLILLLQLI